MKRTLFAALLTLLAASPVFATELPNYNKDAEAVFSIYCDIGKSTVTYFHSPGYGVIEVTVQSGSAFYQLSKAGNDYFFFKETVGAETQEVSHDSWDAKLKEAAPNVFMDTHSIPKDLGPNDCKKK